MKFTTASAVLAFCASALAAPQFGIFGSASTTSAAVSSAAVSAAATTGADTTATSTDLSSAALTSAYSSIAATETATSSSASGLFTENDITANIGCKEVTVIFARGTLEPGNVGIIAGPPFFASLKSSLGADKVAVQGIDYDASILGNVELGLDGGSTMQTMVTTALSQCPDTKIVLSGYSQGAMVAHYAADNLTASQVSAAVLFGDPMNGGSFGKMAMSNLKEFCATGDEVCSGLAVVITPFHLTYGADADTAAAFVKSTLGL